jgi:hypothetical protein
LNCECNVCIEFFIAGYEHAINSVEAITFDAFSCICCKEPKSGSSKFDDQIEHLTRLVFKEIILQRYYLKSYCVFYFI